MTDITLPAPPLPNPDKDAPISVAKPRRPPAATLRTDDRPQRRFGILVLLVSFGGFAAWSALAPIGSAAVAPGVVTVESARKTVQNLAGGFVEEILVREGDQVSAGQLLVRLDDTESKAQLEMARGSYLALIAEEARLIAERDGNEAIRFPPDLLSLEEDARAKEAMAVQQRLFQSRRTALKGEKDVQTQRIEQLEEQIKGYEGLIASKEERSRLYDTEIKSMNKLFQKGFSDNSKLREWERLGAELDGEKSQHQSEIASARLRITETELQILQLERNFNTEVATRLQEVQPQIADQRERIRALGKTLERTDIRAPVAGAVVGLTVHTEGGVIKPGQDILGIVPQGDSLIVEAHVPPNDIDRVAPGLRADIRFTAFNVRTTPTVSGRVLTVSGDRIDDPSTHQPYYLARIQVPEEAMAKLQHISLVPGMSATVMINTGEQTLFGYLIKPITDRLATALRED
jgi:membrane fusion protein, epimerase transport system